MKEYIRKHGVLKLIFALLVAIAAIAVIVMPISAEDVIEPPANETLGGENSPSGEDNGGGAVNTPPATENEPVEELGGAEANIFTRVFEFVETNIDEILTALSVAVMGAYSLYQRRKNGTLISGIGRVLKSQGGVAESNAVVAASQKDIAEKQEKLGGDVEILAKELAEAKKVIAVLNVGVATVIEVLHISTINNRNVPQPMKNLTTSKYAKYLSTINDDAEVKATYDEMRGILGITEGAPNEETNT